MSTSKEEIVEWCQEYLAGIAEIPVADVDPAADFDRLGIDSAIAVSLLVEVEDRYGVDLPPEALFESPNINAVAEYLHSQIQQTAVER